MKNVGASILTFVVVVAFLAVLGVADEWTRPAPAAALVLSEAGGTMGNTTLTGATTVVSTPAVKSDSRIFITSQDGLVNAGVTGIGVKNAGVNFTIVSANILDARQVAWIIVS